MFRQREQSANNSQQSIYWFSVVFQRISVENLPTSLVTICQTTTLSNSRRLDTHFLSGILLFCLFIGFYFIQLLQLVNLFHLFGVVFWTSKHSRHQFTFRISKNKYMRFVFSHIFQVIFYSSLSFLCLALIHSSPFLSVCSRSQFGLYVPCLEIYSVILPDNTDLSLKCQRQQLVKVKSMSFFNSETQSQLQRFNFRIKVTCHLQVKPFIY